MITLEEALTAHLLAKIKELRKRLRKAQQNAAMQCSNCEGYWLSLADGARLCSCTPEEENEEASK